MSKRTQLDIAAVAARQPTPEHRRFQSLLTKIGRARERLESWHRQLPAFAQAHAEQVAPLEARLRAARREWAFELEALLGAKGWSRADRETLDELICDIAGSLIDAGDAGDEEDAELKALYNRHADIDFDRAEQQELRMLKGVLEDIGGVDLGDGDVESAQDLEQRIQAGMAEQARRFEQRGPARPKRKTAAEKRADDDQRRISQTVREVYRKLASALHPDRAADGAERELRTTQMQRANAAYEAGDLLALLELQLQIEQVDIAHAAGIAAEQVRHFNKVLAEQLRELELEIQEREQAFCMGYGLLPEQRPDPNKLGPLLKEEIRDLAAAQAEFERDRRALRGEPARVRQWLKRHRAELREFDEPFF